MRLALLSSAALCAASSLLCGIDAGAPDPADTGGGGADPATAGNEAAAAAAAAAVTDKPAKPGKAREMAHVVWAAPGHATFAIGVVVRTDPDTAEALRAAGKARPADPAEVKVHKDRIHDFG